MPTDVDTTLILPVFNEERRIVSTLEALNHFRRAADWPFFCLIVNDGSNDQTGAIISAFAKTEEWLQILDNRQNRGKGAAVRDGMLKANTRFTIFLDADLPIPLATLLHARHHLRQGADLVLGARRHPDSIITGQSRARRFISISGNLMIRVLTGLPHHDTQCGFKGFRRECAQRLFTETSCSGYIFDVELLMRARQRNYNVVEIPVHWTHIPNGSFKPNRDCIPAMIELLKLVLQLRFSDRKAP
jgi:dolichyl-phosphate beta-glucosyltransferase